MNRKKRYVIVRNLILVFVLMCIVGCTPTQYQQYFTNKRYRFDYSISGSVNKQQIESIKLFREKKWAGSKVNLIDTFEYGKYLFEVYDDKSNQLIYSRGFSDLFSEWQTTDNAQTEDKEYKQSILFPAPKSKVRIDILKRDSTMKFTPLYSLNITPKSDSIKKRTSKQMQVRNIHKKVNAAKALDIIILSEGYRKEQKEKFYSDAARFKKYLFSWEPYRNFTESINFSAVFGASQDSGVDIPGEEVWKNTLVDAHFYTFDVERYLTVPSLTKVYDCLSDFAFDQIVILVNSEKYGGGGVYNSYNIFTADNALGEKLFLHEFGHGFASLADEYFQSNVAYQEVENIAYEPYEPNITTLINFKAKWKAKLQDTVPVPTPDSIKYNNTVGVFEGANYVSKGFYRPYRNCAMRSTAITYFCPICKESIEKLIRFYSK